MSVLKLQALEALLVGHHFDCIDDEDDFSYGASCDDASRILVHKFMATLDVVGGPQINCVNGPWCIGVGRIGLMVGLDVGTKWHGTVLLVVQIGLIEDHSGAVI